MNLKGHLTVTLSAVLIFWGLFNGAAARAGAGTSGPVEIKKKERFVVVTAGPDLPRDGIAVIFSFKRHRPYQIRILPEDDAHPRNQYVNIADEKDPELGYLPPMSDAWPGQNRVIRLTPPLGGVPPRGSTADLPELEVRVKPGDPAQIVFPEIVESFKAVQLR